MPRFLHAALALMLYAISSTSSAQQQFDSFRFVGEVSPAVSGSVSSIEFSAGPSGVSSRPTGKLSYLDVAGLSTVYDVVFTASNVIKPDMPVFMPQANFGAGSEPSLNLDQVQFLTAKLVNPENADSKAPAHWFRMTLHDNTLSGVFRIANRVYSIKRDVDSVVEVRTTQSTNESFQPSKQLKITAVIDEAYVFEDPSSGISGLNNLGHIYALESLHVAEGLIADTLNLAFKVDQLVYRPATALTSVDSPTDYLAGAQGWLAENAAAFGITDNYATFVFRGADVSENIASNIVLQDKSEYDQLNSAWYFGQLLGVPQQSGTLSGSDQQQSLASAYWNNQQREYLVDNPPPAELTRILSYDEPEIEITEPTANTPIPDFLLDSESEESNNGIGLQSDTDNPSINAGNDSVDTGGSSGGGAFIPLHLIALYLIILATVRCKRIRRLN